jgi:hypothetical protein
MGFNDWLWEAIICYFYMINDIKYTLYDMKLEISTLCKLPT